MGRQPNDGGNYGRKPIVDRIMQEFNNGTGPDGDLNLTEEENNILQRWIFIDNLYRRRKPRFKPGDIMNTTMLRFGISRSQYFEDLKNCDKFFGTKQSLSKAYVRILYVDRLEHLADVAESEGDYRTAKECLAEAAKLQQLHEPDLDPEDRGPGVFVMAITAGDESLPEIIDLDKLQKLRPDLFAKMLEYADQPNVTPGVMDNMLSDGR